MTLRIEGACRVCGACCRNLIVVHRGRPVTSIDSFEKLKRRNPQYVNFRCVGSDQERGYLYFTCSLLRDDNTCSNYDNRPAMCRRYPFIPMFKLGGKLLPGCGYRVTWGNAFHRLFEKALRR